MPAVDLDQFAADMADRVKTFAEKYRKRHKENPEHYPIVFPDDNAGVWDTSQGVFEVGQAGQMLGLVAKLGVKHAIEVKEEGEHVPNCRMNSNYMSRSVMKFRDQPLIVR